MAKRDVTLPRPGERESTARMTVPPEIIERTSRPATLDQIKGPGSPRHFRLDGGPLSIGRGSDASICVVSMELSLLHASLTRSDSEWSVADLGSRNGLFLNGVRVHSATLRDGDAVQLGDAIFVFSEGD